MSINVTINVSAGKWVCIPFLVYSCCLSMRLSWNFYLFNDPHIIHVNNKTIAPDFFHRLIFLLLMFAHFMKLSLLCLFKPQLVINFIIILLTVTMMVQCHEMPFKERAVEKKRMDRIVIFCRSQLFRLYRHYPIPLVFNFKPPKGMQHSRQSWKG